MMERTLVLIKPDGVQRGLVGRIVSRFEDVGLKLLGMKMVWVDKDFSKKHYKELLKKPFYPWLETMITEGPVVAMVIEGLHAVELVRKLVGPTEPRSAAPGTIRGDFSHHSYAYTDLKEKSIKNLVHASGNLKEAEVEVGLWFSDKELHIYQTVHEKHVF
ncbi:MAG: nucleoside-diphosphate kinase [Candidatus Woesearchaeota archaeon]